MKLCYKCKQTLPSSDFGNNKSRKDGLADECKKCKSNIDKDYNRQNKDKIKIAKHNDYLNNREVVIKRTCAYAKENASKHNEWGKKSRLKLKTEVFNHYCNNDIKCNHCNKNDISLLTIDHIDGSGAEHRREIGLFGGYNFYVWLKQNDYPNNFQVLCWNCQYKKRMKELSADNPTEIQIRNSKYRQALKEECLEHYGSVCPCGETDKDVLTLDHTNDDGARHREKVNARGFNFYIYLRKNGFPNDPPLQVLCLNCNMTKRNNYYEERRKYGSKAL